MKKIAICFSGGIRYFDSCIATIIKNFVDPMRENENQVDIFFYLTYINELDKNLDNNFKMVPSKFDRFKLLKTLEPKKYKLVEYNYDLQREEMNINGEDFNDYEWKDERHKNYGYSAFGMYAKVFKCNQLKSEYEIENCFIYDYVWRARLDYIFLDKISFTDNVCLIKDRYATSTNKETNDKFFGGPSHIMDQICNIYNEIPEYIERFKKENIMFEGQNLITNKLIDLRNSNDIKTIDMIGHRNIYYKCQGRHQLKISKKKILLDLDEKLVNDLGFILLKEGYQVFSYFKNRILELFPNFNIIPKNCYGEFEYLVTFDKYNKNTIKKKTFILSNDLDIEESLESANNELDEINSFSITRNNTYIHFEKDLNVTKILFSLINCKATYKVYKIDKIDYNLEINQNVKYYIPDRGRYSGIITDIKNDVYIIDKNRYFRNEIEIINYNNLIEDKYLFY